MSEELLQTSPMNIGKYTYYRLGNTTLNQLKAKGIIPKKDYKDLKDKRPDGLVSFHSDIKAVVEYKQPTELKSIDQIEKAIQQEISVAKALCKLLIVTDGSKSFWVNALNGQRIKDPSGNELTTVFHPFGKNNTSTIERLIEDIDASISKDCSEIQSAKVIDPTPLAKRLWQTIWVATGKSPVKCLYNVVELFIFKFLSDLKILPEDISFDRVYAKAQDDHEDALDYYARNTRERIYRLFPRGEDGTTIINGTIFVNESNQPNRTQSLLFQKCLEHLNHHTEAFGSLTKIDKQFKTKLYESFLKQEVEALGQYFTPRKVIQSIIRMAGMDQLSFVFKGKRICDPFCGVGGFLVEMLNMNDRMMESYIPDSNGDISPPFVLAGYDKGFEADDERTIILAKSNMLIYLAEILFKHPILAPEFARAFNDTFTLFRDNLGTFGHIVTDEDKKFDIIMSNPPYVTSGSSIIKEQIAKTPHTANQYPVNGLGLESLSLEWIVKALRKDGKAYVIIPDGILGRIPGGKLRHHILRECCLDAVISLPTRTFFANFERTYILALTKKHEADYVQQHPVFTYLVSHIGERLTSIAREDIEEDDLPEMERLFRVFESNKESPQRAIFAKHSRCKIQPFERFRDEPHWVVDRWWTQEEKAALEDDAEVVATKAELQAAIGGLHSAIEECDHWVEATDDFQGDFVEVELRNENLFEMFIGRRTLKREVKQIKEDGDIPIYSANVFEPMGYASSTRILHFEVPSVLWGIDGNFDLNIIPEGVPFGTTDHCGTLRILNPDILPEYVLYTLHQHHREENYNRSFRAALANMRRIKISVPVRRDGTFDVDCQRVIADRFMSVQEKAKEIESRMDWLNSNLESYLKKNRWTKKPEF